MRQRNGTRLEGRAICVASGCGNLATANQGRMCPWHCLPTLATHYEPGSLPDPCEIVDGAGKHGKDYGSIRSAPAHRAVWEMHHGPIPAGMWVLHKCDRPGCVRIEHLWLGTKADNIRDMDRKGRRYAPAPGEQHWSAKVTAADVVAIRAAVAAGESQRSVGERFGIRQGSVSRIVLRQSWKQIP